MSTKTRGALAMFVGAVLAAAVVLPAAPAPVQPGNTPVASYLHDVSQPIPGMTVLGSILEQHSVIAADGIELDTWIIRPDIPGPVPVVLDVTPYWGGGSPIADHGKSHLLGRFAETLVPRGYAYGIASVRGTGNSGGCFTIGGPAEADDTAAVIEHYGRQPWSNGRVGLVGAGDGRLARPVPHRTRHRNP